MTVPSYAAVRRSITSGTRLEVLAHPAREAVLPPGLVLTVTDVFPTAFYFEHGGRRHQIKWPKRSDFCTATGRAEFRLALERGESIEFRILPA